MELSSSACSGLSKDLGSNASLNGLLSCSKMSAIKIFFQPGRLFFEWRTFPRCFNWTLDSAPFFKLLSGFPSQNTWLPLFPSLPVPVMWLPVPSGSGDVISGHVTSPWAHDPSGPWFPVPMTTPRPIRSQKLSTNQKPALAARWAPFTTIGPCPRSRDQWRKYKSEDFFQVCLSVLIIFNLNAKNKINW